MAGDWIKMRTNLDTDTRVIELAAMLELPELHVVGCLWKLWAWADQHTLDGNAIRVTCVTLDRFTGVAGFADALRKVGWLDGRDSALTFPRFAEHNGQTAKKRAETKERVANHRNTKAVTDVTQKVLPEKSREEKSNTAAACAAAEKFKTLDTDELRRLASKLGKASGSKLDADFVWRVVVVSEAISRGMVSEMATKIAAKEVGKPKQYLEAAMRDECRIRGFEWSEIQKFVKTDRISTAEHVA